MSSRPDLADFVRDIPDFPRQGILFKDVMPMLRNPDAFRTAVEDLGDLHPDADVVCGIDARGFIFGAAVAFHLGLPFAPVRKVGKLPGEIDSVAYELEYGEEVLEMQADGIQTGQRCVVVDDLLATGGTASAAAALIERRGGDLLGYAFLVELAFLGGRKRLPHPEGVRSLLVYE